MIEVLKSIEHNQILELLNNPNIWKSKFIDYETPFVERVYTELDNRRLSLHIIHPCEKPFVHPHVWQSAMHVIKGEYEMSLFFPENGRLVEVSRVISKGDFYYEMLEENAQHSVKPIGDVCITVMLTSQPIWKSNAGIVTKEMVELSE